VHCGNDHAPPLGTYRHDCWRILFNPRSVGVCCGIQPLSYPYSRLPLFLPLIVLYLYSYLILVLRPGESLPLRTAKLLDVFCGYFAFRGLVQNLADLRSFLRDFVFLLIPYVALLAVESATKSNPFRIIGGNNSIWMRDSFVRCFGSFRHPSLLGSVGATFFPIFVGLAFERESRWRAVIGAGLCFAIVFFSSSGGPLSAWATGVFGWLMWSVRTRMRAIRWLSVVAIAALGLVMKAPVWYLIARVSGITGGTGWHRAYLIDVSVQYIEKWWLFGIPTAETHGWFPYNLASTGGADVTNQYISYALNAGLPAVFLFFLFLTRTFSSLGRTMALLRASMPSDPLEERLLWGMGVMVAVHLSNWLGITYWDQFSVLWLFQMAAISSICQTFLQKAEQYSVTSVTPPDPAVAYASNTI